MRNPHFDDGLLIWRDEYSNRFGPPPNGYPDQFDLQWELALQDPDFHDRPGSSVNDDYIDDRMLEWTGVHPRGGGLRDERMGVRPLDRPLDPELIRGRACIDRGGPRNSDRLLRWDPDQEEGVWNATEETELSC